MNGDGKPIVLITGAAGNLGTSLAAALTRDYRVVGLDRRAQEAPFPVLAVDLTSDESVEEAVAAFRERFGTRVASVVHLAAYFDFTGEDNPLYQTVNVEGTRRLLRALQVLDVEQFVYSGTLLVHAAGRPGERIDEDQPIAPKWAYPRSKAEAEDAIRRDHGKIPYVLLHLAGVYDEGSTVPTLAQQIARIYEREFQSYLYSGDPNVGQSMLHKADMVDAFRRVIDRRKQLPPDLTVLIGEPEAVGYGALQDAIGGLIHGAEEWATLRVPKSVAAVGAWAQERLEPVIPDALDQGEKPFVKPFMVAMADDNYALDVTRARELLGWEPRHRLLETLPDLISSLKADPLDWYERNGVTAPAWMQSAEAVGEDPEAVRARYQAQYAEAHHRYRWAHLLNIGLGGWLLASPPLIGLDETPLVWSEVLSGTALVVVAALALAGRLWWARWVCAAIGVWVMSAPILLWTESAAAYVNDTLIGALIFGFAVCTPPEPGVTPVAAATGPSVPPGWDYNPSAWTQRLPIIGLAFLGLFVSRYLAAYQLGHINAVWEPFFPGGPDPKNGTEEIITSSVSEAWPVSDAAVGAMTYMLEIVTGVVGSQRRWRTMPWLVVLFGLMIVPLGVVSISFIVIQPIMIGTWCSLCLFAAAAMLIQIPYSLDELLATLQFLRRRQRAGQSWLRVFLVGDTDVGSDEPAVADEFDRGPGPVLREMVGGGVNLPWNLALSAAIGVWLMFTRLTVGAQGAMANADHLIGALVLTTSAIAAAEVARPVRWLNALFGVALLATPFAFSAGATGTAASLVCGLALIGLSVRRGRIIRRYGEWNRLLA